MEPLISIVILNYMTYDLTIECIEKLKKQSYENLKIIIVDNNSQNNSSEILSDYCEKNEILFYASQENGGYAKGNNIGIRSAIKLNSQYIIVMNNDVRFLDNNFLKKTIRYFESNTFLGLMGPEIYTNGIKGSPLFEYRPIWYSEVLSNFLRIPMWLISKRKKKKDKDINKIIENQEKIEKKVYAVSGCCMIFTSECLKKIGGFDEGTFLYNEELIIGEKCYKNQIPVIYNSDLHVLHEHGVTIKQFVQIKQQCKLEETSRMYYYKKYRDDVYGWKYLILNISAKFNRIVNIPIIHYFDKKRK